MLRHLRVTNFAILSDVALDLGEGLNVLTGETGAGKSLIVDAVNLLRGGRASADIPRAGASEAVVEAIFEPPDDLRARINRLTDFVARASHDWRSVDANAFHEEKESLARTSVRLQEISIAESLKQHSSN